MQGPDEDGLESSTLERELELIIDKGLEESPRPLRPGGFLCRSRSRSRDTVPERCSSHTPAAGVGSSHMPAAGVGLGGKQVESRSIPAASAYTHAASRRPSFQAPGRSAPMYHSPSADISQKQRTRTSLDSSQQSSSSGKRSPTPTATAGSMLAEAEEKYASAVARLSQLRAFQASQLTEMKQQQHRQQAAATGLERAEKDLQLGSERSKKSEAHASWFDDLLRRCEKVAAKKAFAPSVAEDFDKVVAALRKTTELQNAEFQDSGVALRVATESREAASKEVAERKSTVLNMLSSTRRIEEDIEHAQLNIYRLEQRVQHLRMVAQVEHEAFDVRQETADLEKASRGATAQREQAKQYMSEYQEWTEDLLMFFKGHQVQNREAVLQGLKSLLPSNESLLILIPTMLSDKYIDRQGSTVRSVVGMLSEHMHREKTRLHESLQKCTKHCQELGRRLAGLVDMRQKKEAQLQDMLLQARCGALAAPVRNAAVSEAARRYSSSSGGAAAINSGGVPAQLFK